MERLRVLLSSIMLTLLAAAVPPAGAGTAEPVPEIESVHMTFKVFAVAKGNTADVVGNGKGQAARGTRIRVTLSDPGILQLLAQSRGEGRVNAGGKCVRETRGNRKRPDCTLLRTRMTILRAPAVAGRNRFVFTGRAPGVKLKPGPYQFTITASNGVTDSEPEEVRFRIVPG
jgi:hypothetical protein